MPVVEEISMLSCEFISDYGQFFDIFEACLPIDIQRDPLDQPRFRLNAVNMERKRVCFMFSFTPILVKGTKFDFADHHLSLPLANFHHQLFGDQKTLSVVIVTPQLNSDDCALVVASGEDGTSHLSRLRYHSVSQKAIFDFDNLTSFSEYFPLMHWFGVSIETHRDIFSFEVVFDFKVLGSENRSFQFQHCQTIPDALFILVALLFDEVIIYSEGSYLDGGYLFVETWRVEHDIFVEALILFAVDIVCAGDEDV